MSCTRAVARSLKPLILKGTAPFLGLLEAICSVPSAHCAPSITTTLSFFVHNGFTGKKDELEDSAEYPYQFCLFIVKLLKETLDKISAGGQPVYQKIKAKWAKEALRRRLELRAVAT